MAILLREPIDEPQLLSDGTSTSDPELIFFMHPGYGSGDDDDANSNCIVSLRARDDGGIDYPTAHTACGILAGNRWDGFFSTNRDGSQVVSEPTDGILRERKYYFCLPDTTQQPFPILGRFSDYRFPHNNMPPIWQQLRHRQSLERDSRLNSGYCCISKRADAVEQAHLVPSVLSRWWLINDMSR